MRVLALAATAALFVPAASPQTARTYEYDALGRLIKVTPSGGGSVTYSYDAADNRTSVTAVGGPPPTFSVDNFSAMENAGPSFFLRLSPAAPYPIQVTWEIAPGTAQAGIDYVAVFAQSPTSNSSLVYNAVGQGQTVTGTMQFIAGDDQAQFSINNHDDTQQEPSETYFFRITSVSAGVIGNSQATGTIIDNDAGAQFSINWAQALEGQPVVFTVTRSGNLPGSYTINYATGPDNKSYLADATPNVDYTPVSGTLSFGPNVTTRTITVPTTHDTTPEAHEFFSVTLSNIQGGSGTIISQPGLGGPMNDD